MREYIIGLILGLVDDFITPEHVKKAKLALVCWLKSQVENTENEIDDAIVAIIAKALEVDLADCK